MTILISLATEGINLFTPTLRTFLSYYAFLNAAPSQTDLSYWNEYLTTLDEQMRDKLLADMVITNGSQHAEVSGFRSVSMRSTLSRSGSSFFLQVTVRGSRADGDAMATRGPWLLSETFATDLPAACF